MNAGLSHPWLHRFAVLTAVATLGLIGMGGLVTSRGAGMAVPDWPTSYGYNMFALPIRFWQGGVFYEHSHRLWASVVGLLVVFLTRWLGGHKSRGPLALIGLAEVAAGVALVALKPELKGAGHFLSGIGGVVLLASLVWVRHAASAAPLPALGWAAFGLVQIQGLLGGLRVVLFQNQIGIFHAALAQLFFGLLCVIALLTSRWWHHAAAAACGCRLNAETISTVIVRRCRRIFLFTTALIFLQLILGAMMRHEHAGLAVPDFPLAYGKLWPDTSAAAVAAYNAQRLEVTAANPITALQIGLQLTHRLLALVILVSVAAAAWQTRKSGWLLRRLTRVWLGLILVQAALGAWTIWSNKAADVATAHVLTGAVSLALGGVLTILCARFSENAERAAGESGRPQSD